MNSEKEKMVEGALYNALDHELVEARLTARRLMHQFNMSAPDEQLLRKDTLKSLIDRQGESLIVEPPFYCDYGFNIVLGDRVFFNFGAVLLDVMPIEIGDDVLFGPNVQIYTAMHPLDWRERSSGLEFAKPIRIGSNVWVGGSVVICPGVEIGARSVIGAGSVVTRSIPPDVFAAGNPCRVVRSLDKEAVVGSV